MKKVLIATNSLNIGGAETNILELAIGLKNSKKYEPIIVSNGGELTKSFERSGIKHYNVHLNTKNPIYYVKTLIKLNEIVKKEKISLIHSHARIPSIFCNIIAKKNNIPLVASVHYPFKINYLYKRISKWGDKTIAVSEDLKKYVLNNYNIKNKEVPVIINGIDTDKFNGNSSYSKIISEYNLLQNANRIVHTSRLDKTTIRTLNILIDIFLDLNKKIPNLELIIVGEGKEKKYLQNKANIINNKLNRNAIIFTGLITQNIDKFVSMADLFIGVSRSALEAMSSKKAVILSGNQGYYGLFNKTMLEKAIKTNFCCRDSKSVTSNILKRDIINYFNNTSDAEKKEIAKYNRQVVLKHYSKNDMINNTISIYDECLTKKNIVICGCYGKTNSGDDSILFSIISQLKSINKNINITALSLNTKQTIKDYNIDSIYSFNIIKLNKVLKECDLFISGGGTLLQNATSTRSLLYYLYTIVKAKKYGTKVLLYGCGVGPIYGKKIRNITSKILLKNVDDILVRDVLSCKELEDLNIDLNKILVGIDPSMLLDDYIEYDDQIFEEFNLNSNKRYVGIALKKSKTCDISDIIKVIRYLSKKGLVPVLIPMNYKEDFLYLKRIKERSEVNCHIIDKNISFYKKYNLISKMELVFAMRLHAILFSYLLNVKVIGISYDQKINAFCNDYNISNIIDVEDFNYDKFIEVFSNIKSVKADKERIKKLNENNIKILNKYLK